MTFLRIDILFLVQKYHDSNCTNKAFFERYFGL